MSFIQPHHDYINNGVEFGGGIRVKRQYLSGYPYNSYAVGSQFGRANPQIGGQPFGAGQPFGMPIANNQPSALLPGTPFGTQQATCDCPGKAMELEKCSGPSGCSNSGQESTKNRKKGQSNGDEGEASALSEANEGESRGAKGKGYGKQRLGVGSSVELTGGDMEVAASNDGCQFGEWGAWNSCRGSCKNGSRSRTRACRRQANNSGETYNTFKKFVRAVDDQCECDGDSVETERCKPKNCDNKSEHDTPPIKDKGILGDEDESALNCYWSEWGEWSSCSKSMLKRRTRLCVGLKALLTNCKCEGSSTEEKTCNTSTAKKPSSAVLAVSRNILNDRLSRTDSKLDDLSLASRQFDSPSVNKDDSSEALLSDSKVCSFLNWEKWGSCQGSCDGEGKRKRTRMCPCRSCGNGAIEETETCQTELCLSTSNNKKYPFDR